MNFSQAQQNLNDLPSTFKRLNAPYTQWVDSLTSAIVRGTSAIDALNNQVTQISNAQFGWLDIWGLLFGIPRLTGEPDSHYLARIQYEVTAGAGTPCAIVNWIYAVWGISVTLTESFPAVGYSLKFPATLTLAQINIIVNSLVKIRPAGIPFTVQSAAISSPDGPYLTTINFLNAPRTTGAFVGGEGEISPSSTLTLNPSTNNSQPLLPDIFLNDPALQGLV